MSFLKTLAGVAGSMLGDMKDSTVEVVARYIAKYIFLRMLKDIKPTQIITAIKENRNLCDTFEDWETWLDVGEPFKLKIIENIDRITPQLIIDYLLKAREPHPSQAELILNTPNGPEWFVAQMEFIKQKIKEYYQRCG